MQALELRNACVHPSEPTFKRVSVKAGLWTVDWTMDWTMDWVATNFIQSHPIHSAPLAIGLHFYWQQTRSNTTSAMALCYQTINFKLRALDKRSATKSKLNYSNRLTKLNQSTELHCRHS